MPEVKPNHQATKGPSGASGLPPRSEVRAFLANLLREVCGIEPALITDSARLDRELAIESVHMVQIQVALEQEYDITLDFLEILRLNGFGPICDYIYLQATHEHAR